MAKQIAEYDPDNLIGNVIGTISDRTGMEPLVVAAKLALALDPNGDFRMAEDHLWQIRFGPMIDDIQDLIGMSSE